MGRAKLHPLTKRFRSSNFSTRRVLCATRKLCCAECRELRELFLQSWTLCKNWLCCSLFPRHFDYFVSSSWDEVLIMNASYHNNGSRSMWEAILTSTLYDWWKILANLFSSRSTPSLVYLESVDLSTYKDQMSIRSTIVIWFSERESRDWTRKGRMRQCHKKYINLRRMCLRLKLT